MSFERGTFWGYVLEDCREEVPGLSSEGCLFEYGSGSHPGNILREMPF